MAAIPLEYRLPNPPAMFHGRKPEMRWMTSMLKRTNMVVVAGLGGQGKTALALEVLHRNFTDQVPRVICIRPTPSGESLLGQLWRVFARVSSLEIAESVLRTDPDFALASLIDIADEGPWWVLVEDLHRLADSCDENTLRKIARYARESRWIFTTRLAPGPELNQHLLHLENLKPAALEAIAKTWDPRLSRVAREKAVSASAGSPWRIFQALSGGNLDDPTLLDGVAEPQHALLQALSVLGRAVPVPLLLDVVPGTDLDDWLALKRRGLVVGSAQGCRLHDLTREVAEVTGPSRQRCAALCRALLGSSSPELKLEGLKLGRQLGTPMLELLGEPDKPPERRAIVDELIQCGLGLEFDSILAAERCDALSTVRMRVALNASAYHLFETIAPPATGSSNSARLLWARGLYVRHRFELALQSAQDLLDEVDSDEVRVLHASCIAALGRLTEAEELLQAFVPDDPDLELERVELLAAVYAGTGQRQRALALADQLRPQVAGLRGAALAKRCWKLVRVYYLVGQLEQARETLEWVTNEIGERGATLYQGRAVLEFRSILALGLGRFDEVGDVQRRLASDSRSAPSALRDQLRGAQVQLDTGALDGLRARLRDMMARAEALAYGDALHSAMDKMIQLDTLVGSPSKSVPAPGLSVQLPVFELQWRLGHLRWRILDGHPWTAEADALLVETEGHPQQRGTALMTSGIALAMQGEHERANQQASTALHLLRQTGQRVLLAKSLVHACDLAWVSTQLEVHAQLTNELRSVSRSMPSDRFAASLAWHAALASGHPLRPEFVEELTRRGDPVIARRARALLGDSARLHAWDRLHTEHLLGLSGTWQRVHSTAWSADGPVWGVDFHRCVIWDHEGSCHALPEGSAVLGLVRYLVSLGGSASKEQLVCCVWDESEYHPLNHDNRLRLTVRRLRTMLGPGDPVRALEDGYALCGRTRTISDS